MKIRLIMNPSSRSGRGRRLWKYWQDSLQSAHVGFESVVSKSAQHAFDLAKDSGNCHTVVAVGGDGTINRILDGVMQSDNAELRMGVLYAGTSPDFCRFHHIPVDPGEAVQRLINGEHHYVDVAEITYHSRTGERIRKHFGCSCNIGMGADVARVSNQLRGYVGDVAGTMLALIRAVYRCEKHNLTLKTDEKLFTPLKLRNISLKNRIIPFSEDYNLEMAAKIKDETSLPVFVVVGIRSLS